MKHYLAVFLGHPGAFEKWMQMDEPKRKALEKQGMEAWHAWVEKHASAIVDGGGPLSRTKRIDSAGITDVRNLLSGYTVVKADSQEAAAKMFVGHPHFTIFPGEAVEVMEVLPIPEKPKR